MRHILDMLMEARGYGVCVWGGGGTMHAGRAFSYTLIALNMLMDARSSSSISASGMRFTVYPGFDKRPAISLIHTTGGT